VRPENAWEECDEQYRQDGSARARWRRRCRKRAGVSRGNDLAGVQLPGVGAAANEIKAQRLLLDEDVRAYVQRAEASNIGR
jgi:hypothetical protein